MSAVRVSVGVVTTFPDVYRLLCFLQGFVDRTSGEIGDLELVSSNCRVVRDAP